MSRLIALINYCAENMPTAFNQLLEDYTRTLNLTALIAHVNAFYKGYQRECILVTLISIHEQEDAFYNAKKFVHEYQY